MIQTINKALSFLPKLDPQASALLSPLKDKALSVVISDLDYTISLKVENNNLHATNELTDNILKGKLAYILELVFNKNLQELIIAEKLDFQGSLKDLNEFNTFLNAIDIDVVYKISSLTSPEFASVITKPFDKVKEYLKTSRQETIIDIKDYLTEEKRTLISQNEINIFYKHVQELKQATDRVEAKLKLLQGS
ncbi:SCP2 domain-containing protein [Francisella sp. SYW-9]|uniref:ubiquinone biosynthesis accessory factor UbiJ n=1 Tax=Francisella sp. SYW-9 TaxID=2610888 RepID=UPI00168CDED7|nr:SCP2 sterol-binding domain-containing protein [Francisella sp. SYW-9]